MIPRPPRHIRTRPTRILPIYPGRISMPSRREVFIPGEYRCPSCRTRFLTCEDLAIHQRFCQRYTDEHVATLPRYGPKPKSKPEPEYKSVVFPIPPRLPVWHYEPPPKPAIPDIPEGHKLCPKCEKVFPIEVFLSEGGVNKSYCPECLRKYQKERRLKKNPDIKLRQNKQIKNWDGSGDFAFTKALPNSPWKKPE
jgi:hypothetical protein